jgi:hypothetical protein
LLNIDNNTKTPNSFSQVDFRDFTRGVFNSGDLFHGNNLECFGLQISQATIPDILGGTENSIRNIIKPLSDAIVERLAGLACPQLEGIDQRQYDVFPGYNKCLNGCPSVTRNDLMNEVVYD